MRFADPVVVREKLKRQQAREGNLRSQKDALLALGWFSEVAQDPKGLRVRPEAIVPGDALGSRAPSFVVATGVHGASSAEAYVQKAYLQLRPAILELAINLALYELAACEAREASS